jgi:hypothetical protein
MSAFQKELESKRETSQLWLFDMGDATLVVHFELERALPMGLEERIKWEKAMIGYPVSGHPLEWIEGFIKSKSKNLAAVLDLLHSWKDEILIAEPLLPLEWEENWEWESLDAVDGDVPATITENTGEDIPIESRSEDITVSDEAESIVNLPMEEKKEESIFAQLIGIVTEVRKMQTRSWGMMMVAKVESIGFDFRIVIFPKDYEKYESKITEDTIVVANGRVKYDIERSELSLLPTAPFGKRKVIDESGSVKCFSISVFRDMADTSGMLIKPEKSPDDTSPTQEIIPQAPTKFFIDIPAFWTKEDLLDLKDYLEKAEIWLIPVWIRIQWMEKDTKFSIENLKWLEEWVGKKGG